MLSSIQSHADLLSQRGALQAVTLLAGRCVATQVLKAVAVGKMRSWAWIIYIS